MGCSDSHSIAHQQLATHNPNAQPRQNNFNNNSSTIFYQMQNVKRPNFLNAQQLNQFQKDNLWAIIQRNSLKQFAYYLENQRIPSNVQVGPGNTFWNLAHFCARWDAFECLAYVIKRIYAQKCTLLLSLMNQQTIQGYTAIHVAIEWNAINCFYLMLDSGGVDLSYCDKMNNDVFAKCNLFKRKQMLQVLERFKKGNALMVLMQNQKVNNFKNFNALVLTGASQTRKQYRISNQRIDQIIDTKNRLNRPPPPYQPVKQLPNNQYQNHQKAIQNIQTQNNKTTQSQQSHQIELLINKQKLQQQKRFQQQQKRLKRQQLEEQKRIINYQKQLEIKRFKQLEQKQIQNQIVYQQSQLAKIQHQKQLIRKNIQAMAMNANQQNFNIGNGTKMECPQDIKTIYQAALAKGVKFVDVQFPAQQSSLGEVSKFKFQWQDCVWLRPQQIFPGGRFQVFDGISPEDVKQGTLGVCYYLALLSSIAQHPQRIKKLFRFYDKNLGFYAIQFYFEGKPKTIIVDDCIPCMKGTNEPLFTKPIGAEVWVMILQKAWVKMFGNYLAAQKMSPLKMYQNVLPAPCRYHSIDINRINQIYDEFVQFDKKNYVMSASSLGNAQEQGFVKQHEYSVIAVYNLNGLRLCKVRNPWGKVEYQGLYNQNSPLWTPQLQQAVGFKRGDDGIFFLTQTQFQKFVPIVTISYYRDNYEYSFIEVKSKSNEQVYFTFNVKSQQQLAIKLTQQNQIFRIKTMEYQNAPIRLEIWKLGENYNAQILFDGQPSCMYEMAEHLHATQRLYQNYEPGRYMIRLKVLYDRTHPVSTRGSLRKFIRGTDGKNILQVRQGTSLLSIYGPQTYIFNRLTKQQAQKYLKNGYKNYLLSSPKTSQRLRSVGQDLKPQVLAKDCKMRNQVIYLAQNLLPSHSINFKFKFDHKKFRNISYAYNVDKQREICEWILKPGEWNLATFQIDCPFQEVATQGQLESSFKIIR